MRNKKFRITERDFLRANRKAAREEEIKGHGKQVIFRTTLQKSKKTYSRKKLKKTDIGEDAAHLQSSVGDYPKILLSLNMKKGRSLTPRS